MMATKVITTFLSLTLTLNNLVLNYLQIKGCVMGTICMLTSFGTFEIKKKLLRKVTNLTFYLDKHISRTVKGKSQAKAKTLTHSASFQSLWSKHQKSYSKIFGNVLAISESLKEIFICQPITPFKRCKILTALIGSNKIEKNKVKKDKKSKSRQMLSISGKYKVICFQANTKNNYF